MPEPRLFFLSRKPVALPPGWRNIEAHPEWAVEVAPGVRVALCGTGDCLLPDGTAGYGATVAVWTDPAPETFMDAVAAGRATLDQVDDWVDDWHEGKRQTLRSFLGLSDSEYRRWVMSAASLEAIAAERKTAKAGAGNPVAGTREDGKRDH